MSIVCFIFKKKSYLAPVSPNFNVALPIFELTVFVISLNMSEKNQHTTCSRNMRLLGKIWHFHEFFSTSITIVFTVILCGSDSVCKQPVLKIIPGILMVL